MRPFALGLCVAFCLGGLSVGCQPFPNPTPQPPAPIVVPDVVPAPVGPRVAFVLDASGKVVDAPAIIQACETPGKFTVYSNDRDPTTVVVGGESPVPPSPVPPQPPAPSPGPVVDAAFSDVARIVKAADKAKAAELYAAWDAFAAVSATEPPATTKDLREAIARYEQLAFVGTPLAGAFPGFSAAANAGLVTLLGDTDRPLQAGEAASVLRKLAEACK